MAMTGLEARYRRLLGWFPADYRARHAEEMIGVLMSAAPPDRDRPGLADSVDLLISAARIRLRPGAALWDRDGWRDALAIFSIAGPVLVLASRCLAILGVGVWGVLAVPGTGWAIFSGSDNALDRLMWGQLVVVVLARLGLRRLAAVAAPVPAFAIIAANTFPLSGNAGYLVQSVPWFLGLMVVPGVEIVALLCSPGPRRGIELLTRRHWLYLAIAAVPAAMIQVTGLGEPTGRLAEAIALTGVGAVVILVLACWLSSGTGKRLAVLLAVLAYPSLLLIEWQFGQPFTSYGAYETFETGGVALIACLALGLAYRVRRGSRSAGGTSGEGTADGS
jgi:hypothetical protein